MNKPSKRYILWLSAGNGAYTPTEFDTAEEALLSDRYSSDWYLTEAINEVSAYTRFTQPEKVTKDMKDA